MLKALKLRSSTEFAIVDAEDFDFLSRFEWYLREKGGCQYAYSHKFGGMTMHRLITLFPPYPLVVRHIDDIGLHNFKSNLEVSTQSENMLNATRRMGKLSSLPRGVTQCSRTGKFIAQISINRRMSPIGRYATPEEASVAYEARRAQLFGAPK